MELKVGDEQLKSIVSEAIMRSIDEKQREALIQGALTALLTENQNGTWGNRSTPIQDAFNGAVREVAVATAREMLQKDERIIDQIKGMVTEACQRVFVEQREKVIYRIAEGISSAMECHRRD